MTELNTLAPKKWVANYSGMAPVIDTTDGVRIGDFAIDTGGTTAIIWQCWNNENSAPVWMRVGAVMSVISVSSTPYTASVSNDVFLVNASSASIIINLPAAAAVPGKWFNIKKIDSSPNLVTADGNGSETIDGHTTQTISQQYDNMTIVSDGSNWQIL